MPSISHLACLLPALPCPSHNNNIKQYSPSFVLKLGLRIRSPWISSFCTQIHLIKSPGDSEDQVCFFSWMDSFNKQPRVRFSGLGQGNQEPYNSREGRITPQKTESFKGDRKAQNWFQRQFSGEMSHEDDSSDGEFETVIAAAAFAIYSLEEENLQDQKRSIEGMGSYLSKTKSKREESIAKPTSSNMFSRWLSGKDVKEGGQSAGDSSMRKSAAADQRMLEGSAADYKLPGKAIETFPTIKKTPTFTEKYLNETGSKRYGGGKEMRAEPNALSNKKPTTSELETKADASEKAKMEKIQKRYEKTCSTILEWENEKKMRAKRRMERRERELEMRRARNLQEYRNEISRIDKIVGGARSLAEERKRTDESKMKDKAKKKRLRGNDPHTCFCL